MLLQVAHRPLQQTGEETREGNLRKRPNHQGYPGQAQNRNVQPPEYPYEVHERHEGIQPRTQKGRRSQRTQSPDKNPQENRPISPNCKLPTRFPTPP